MRAVLALTAFLLAGCCECSHLPEHSQRPGDVVRELREALADHEWSRAAECFSPEVRAAHERSMRDGSFEWPLSATDQVVAIDLRGDEAVATLHNMGHGPREAPHELILARNREGLWRVDSWR